MFGEVFKVVGKMVVRKTWRKLFPKYTDDELNIKIRELDVKVDDCILSSDKLGANMARRNKSRCQLKLLRRRYNVEMAIIKEKVLISRKSKKEKIAHYKAIPIRLLKSWTCSACFCRRFPTEKHVHVHIKSRIRREDRNGRAKAPEKVSGK